MAMSATVLLGAKTVAGSLRAWVNAGNIDADGILEDAQALIYARLRVREMLTSTSGTATASATTLALPSDFIAVRKARYTGTGAEDLRQLTADDVERSFSYDENGVLAPGKPLIFYPDKTNLVFPVRCDQAYPLRVLYYQRPQTLGTATTEVTTNFLTNQYSRILRSVCMQIANEWKKDWSAATMWEGKAEKEIQIANAQSDMSLGAQEMEIAHR